MRMLKKLKEVFQCMYSSKIRPKVDILFHELKEKALMIVNDSSTENEAVNNVTKIVSSELAARSKSILRDMLFELTDALMETEFFTDVLKQNKFAEINLRQEILEKYRFSYNAVIDYNEASRASQAMKVGGTVFIIGGAAEIGTVLIRGLSFSSLAPIPVGVLIALSLGAVLADYYFIAPSRSKKALLQALNNYFIEAKRQLLNWFDEVEKYFNMRVEEIKQTL